MDWTFDLGWFIGGLVILIAGGLVIIFHRQIGDNLASGVRSYDRIKLVVGGEYRTDTSNDEDIASNLFNDISIEYYLNSKGNRYLKLFRHGSNDTFDGPIIDTGVAYVLKRKLSNLKNLFKFKHSREYLLRDSLEKARKAQLELQENAIDAMGECVEPFIVPLDNQETKDDNAIDKPTVNRKEDESEP